MKKALRQTQTLRAGCRRNQIFSPRRRPLPRGAGRPKFNQLEMVTTFTYRQTKFGENRCTQFRVIVVTDTVRPPAVPPSFRHRQDRLQYTAPLCLARSVMKNSIGSTPKKQTATWRICTRCRRRCAFYSLFFVCLIFSIDVLF